MASQISTKTPIRLHEAVRGPFAKQYKALIKEHGASFAANMALAELLRSQGHKIPDLAKPKDRIAAGQKKRWRAAKQAKKAQAKKAQEKNERRKASRAKKKAEAATPENA